MANWRKTRISGDEIDNVDIISEDCFMLQLFFKF